MGSQLLCKAQATCSWAAGHVVTAAELVAEAHAGSIDHQATCQTKAPHGPYNPKPKSVFLLPCSQATNSAQSLSGQEPQQEATS